MKLRLWRISLVVLVLAAMGCGVIQNLTGGASNLTNVTDLWGDVPRMDGLSPSDMDMPLYAKVLMQTAMSQILAKGTGSGDWIIFTTDKTPDDIKAFYTNAKMAENGWDPSDNSTCLSGSDKGISQVGVFCVFVRHSESKETGLMIIAAPDEKAKQTNIIFIRVENQTTPTPSS